MAMTLPRHLRKMLNALGMKDPGKKITGERLYYAIMDWAMEVRVAGDAPGLEMLEQAAARRKTVRQLCEHCTDREIAIFCHSDEHTIRKDREAIESRKYVSDTWHRRSVPWLQEVEPEVHPAFLHQHQQAELAFA